MVEFSESRKALMTKLATIQALELAVTKNATNPAFKTGRNPAGSKYADLNSVLDTIIPELNKVGLVLCSFPTVEGLVVLLSDVESEEYVSFIYPLAIQGQTPQQVGSQITYSKRYAYKSLFNLQDEDDDGNVASGITTPVVVTTNSASANEPANWLNASNFPELDVQIKAGKYKSVKDIREDYKVSNAIAKEVIAKWPELS